MDSDDDFRRRPDSDTPIRALSSMLTIEPEVVEFLVRLHDNLFRKNAEAMKTLYEQELNAIIDKYFKSSRLPSIQDVANFFSQSGRYNSMIMALYSELFYRHVFYLGEVTYEDRVDSWNRYLRLFGYFIDECERPDLEEGLNALSIPYAWLWDMMDEFVYQLQETCHWKSRFCNPVGGVHFDTPEAKYEHERKVEEMKTVWCVTTSLEMLHKLALNPAFKTGLHKDLHLDTASVNYQLGYFASISLLRLHVLLGDYYTAMIIVSSIELTHKGLYWKVPACHLTLVYYLGFSFMMLRRYSDAIKILSQLMIFLTKQRSYLVSQSYQQTQMNKQTEKMYLIIIMCHAATKIKLDETVLQTIKEQYANKFYQLQVDNVDAFRDVFIKCCPKFIDPAVPNPCADYSTPNEPLYRQLQVFLEEMTKQRKADEIYSYAKLYHNISLSKLALLMNVGEDPEPLRSQILCVKHLERQYVSNSLPFYHVEVIQTFGDHDEIYIDQNVLHIKRKKTQKIHADYFLQQINKCKITLRNLQTKSDDHKKDYTNIPAH